MAITVMIEDNKEDQFKINLPNGDIEEELKSCLEDVMNNEKYCEDVSLQDLVDAFFEGLDSFGIEIGW